jgi:DNA repair protein RecN (Recombination protein N)
VAGEMIEFLKISSLAIFDEIEIEFGHGLNCITGETGAGKSLILGALTLLMGAKASRDLVRPGREKTSIEALFTISGKELVLRREIYPSGSNRCYIDGSLATIAHLAEVSSGLIHIYGQHEYQDLLNPAQHMAIVEELAELDRGSIYDTYNDVEMNRKHLLDLKARIEQYRREKEDLAFNINELRSINITEGLEDALAMELDLANSSAELKRAAHLADDILYSGSTSVVDHLANVQEHIFKITSMDSTLTEFSGSIENIIAQIEDISLALRDRIETYDYDPVRIETLENQLHTLQDLKNKHKTDEKGLVDLCNDLENKLNMVQESDNSIQEAGHALELAKETYIRKLKDFLQSRRSFTDSLRTHINKDLKELGMPGTRFAIQQTDPLQLEDIINNSTGDISSPANLLKGEFLISTNVGHKLLPLSKVASGGELSRIMLAIKVQQKSSYDATLLFDEIDSGISGQTAFMIANRLKELSLNTQSIVVTHLHQVASLADNHFVIAKNVLDGHTISRVHKVTQMDRVMELARMMGGESPSSTVIEHAKELVSCNENRSQSYH